MYKQTDGPFDRASFYYRSCSSTNDMAQKKLLNAAEGTTFITDYQYKGRGQRGSNWRSSAGENLLFSIILYPTWLASDDLFALQVITSLAIYDVLVTHFPKEVSIKWPNDIYYLDKKLGGILIETNIGEAHKVKTAILGIGLNVNQLHFELPKATSLAIHKGATLDRSLLLADIIDTLSGYYSKLQSGMIDLLWEKYIDSLYRKKGFHIFAAMDRWLEGSIVTVNRSGALVVAERSGGQYMFRPKEVVFI